MAMNPRLTAAGKELQTRAIAGTALVFTKMQMGDGELGETDYKTLTELISPKATLALSSITVENGSAVVKGYFSNNGMGSGFYYRELGLYARNPDNPAQEILYCYANFGSDYQFIAEPASRLIERTVRIIATVDDAPNVTALINDEARYVEEEQLNAAISAHNLDPAAHPHLINFSVTYYIDLATLEDAEDRIGTEDHPFESIDEAVAAIPASTLRVTLLLVPRTASYTVASGTAEFSRFDEIIITSTTSGKPVINGALSFYNCQNVEVKGVKIDGTNLGTDAAPGAITLVCSHATLNDIVAVDFGNTSYFMWCKRSDVRSALVSVYNAPVAYKADLASRLHLHGGRIDGGDVGLIADASEIYLSSVVTDNSASIPEQRLRGGIIMRSAVAGLLSDGDFASHFSNVTNPHNVSLTQAQQKGGTIDTAHGGTGRTSLTFGALLKGSGNSLVDFVKGVGALYAASEGYPQFGTLPISAGGTGQTDIKYGLDSTGSWDFGYYILPGSGNSENGNGGLMIAWGHLSLALDTAYTLTFSDKFNGYKMSSDKYMLLFSQNYVDIGMAVVKATKYADRIEIAGGAQRGLDFLVIGRASHV